MKTHTKEEAYLLRMEVAFKRDYYHIEEMVNNIPKLRMIDHHELNYALHLFNRLPAKSELLPSSICLFRNKSTLQCYVINHDMETKLIDLSRNQKASDLASNFYWPQDAFLNHKDDGSHEFIELIKSECPHTRLSEKQINSVLSANEVIVFRHDNSALSGHIGLNKYYLGFAKQIKNKLVYSEVLLDFKNYIHAPFLNEIINEPFNGNCLDEISFLIVKEKLDILLDRFNGKPLLLENNAEQAVFFYQKFDSIFVNGFKEEFINNLIYDLRISHANSFQSLMPNTFEVLQENIYHLPLLQQETSVYTNIGNFTTLDRPYKVENESYGYCFGDYVYFQSEDTANKAIPIIEKGFCEPSKLSQQINHIIHEEAAKNHLKIFIDDLPAFNIQGSGPADGVYTRIQDNLSSGTEYHKHQIKIAFKNRPLELPDLNSKWLPIQASFKELYWHERGHAYFQVINAGSDSNPCRTIAQSKLLRQTFENEYIQYQYDLSNRRYLSYPGPKKLYRDVHDGLAMESFSLSSKKNFTALDYPSMYITNSNLNNKSGLLYDIKLVKKSDQFFNSLQEIFFSNNAFLSNNLKLTSKSLISKEDEFVKSRIFSLYREFYRDKNKLIDLENLSIGSFEYRKKYIEILHKGQSELGAQWIAMTLMCPESTARVIPKTNALLHFMNDENYNLYNTQAKSLSANKSFPVRYSVTPNYNLSSTVSVNLKGPVLHNGRLQWLEITGYVNAYKALDDKINYRLLGQPNIKLGNLPIREVMKILKTSGILKIGAGAAMFGLDAYLNYKHSVWERPNMSKSFHAAYALGMASFNFQVFAGISRFVGTSWILVPLSLLEMTSILPDPVKAYRVSSRYLQSKNLLQFNQPQSDYDIFKNIDSFGHPHGVGKSYHQQTIDLLTYYSLDVENNLQGNELVLAYKGIKKLWDIATHPYQFSHNKTTQSQTYADLIKNFGTLQGFSFDPHQQVIQSKNSIQTVENTNHSQLPLNSEQYLNTNFNPNAYQEVGDAIRNYYQAKVPGVVCLQALNNLISLPDRKFDSKSENAELYHWLRDISGFKVPIPIKIPIPIPYINISIVLDPKHLEEILLGNSRDTKKPFLAGNIGNSDYKYEMKFTGNGCWENFVVTVTNNTYQISVTRHTSLKKYDISDKKNKPIIRQTLQLTLDEALAKANNIDQQAINLLKEYNDCFKESDCDLQNAAAIHNELSKFQQIPWVSDNLARLNVIFSIYQFNAQNRQNNSSSGDNKVLKQLNETTGENQPQEKQHKIITDLYQKKMLQALETDKGILKLPSDLKMIAQDKDGKHKGKFRVQHEDQKKQKRFHRGLLGDQELLKKAQQAQAILDSLKGQSYDAGTKDAIKAFKDLDFRVECESSSVECYLHESYLQIKEKLQTISACFEYYESKVVGKEFSEILVEFKKNQDNIILKSLILNELKNNLISDLAKEDQGNVDNKIQFLKFSELFNQDSGMLNLLSGFNKAWYDLKNDYCNSLQLLNAAITSGNEEGIIKYATELNQPKFDEIALEFKTCETGTRIDYKAFIFAYKYDRFSKATSAETTDIDFAKKLAAELNQAHYDKYSYSKEGDRIDFIKLIIPIIFSNYQKSIQNALDKFDFDTAKSYRNKLGDIKELTLDQNGKNKIITEIDQSIYYKELEYINAGLSCLIRILRPLGQYSEKLDAVLWAAEFVQHASPSLLPSFIKSLDAMKSFTFDAMKATSFEVIEAVTHDIKQLYDIFSKDNQLENILNIVNFLPRHPLLNAIQSGLVWRKAVQPKDIIRSRNATGMALVNYVMSNFIESLLQRRKEEGNLPENTLAYLGFSLLNALPQFIYLITTPGLPLQKAQQVVAIFSLVHDMLHARGRAEENRGQNAMIRLEQGKDLRAYILAWLNRHGNDLTSPEQNALAQIYIHDLTKALQMRHFSAVINLTQIYNEKSITEQQLPLQQFPVLLTIRAQAFLAQNKIDDAMSCYQLMEKLFSTNKYEQSDSLKREYHRLSFFIANTQGNLFSMRFHRNQLSLSESIQQEQLYGLLDLIKLMQYVFNLPARFAFNLFWKNEEMPRNSLLEGRSQQEISGKEDFYNNFEWQPSKSKEVYKPILCYEDYNTVVDNSFQELLGHVCNSFNWAHLRNKKFNIAEVIQTLPYELKEDVKNYQREFVPLLHQANNVHAINLMKGLVCFLIALSQDNKLQFFTYLDRAINLGYKPDFDHYLEIILGEKYTSYMKLMNNFKFTVKQVNSYKANVLFALCNQQLVLANDIEEEIIFIHQTAQYAREEIRKDLKHDDLVLLDEKLKKQVNENASAMKIKELLSQGANPDLISKTHYYGIDSARITMKLSDELPQTYLLHELALKNRADLIKLFCEYGASMNVKNLYGMTALEYYLASNVCHKEEAILTLLEVGLNPNKTADYFSYFTPHNFIGGRLGNFVAMSILNPLHTVACKTSQNLFTDVDTYCGLSALEIAKLKRITIKVGKDSYQVILSSEARNHVTRSNFFHHRETKNKNFSNIETMKTSQNNSRQTETHLLSKIVNSQ